MNDFKFYIGPVGSEVEVFPLNIFGLSIVFKQDVEFIFQYLKELNNELIFDNRNGDYDYVTTLFSYAKIRFSIEKNSNIEFEGFFNELMCEVDSDNKTIKVKPIEETIFKKIKDEWEEKHNVLEIVSSVNTLLTASSFATRYEFVATPYDSSMPPAAPDHFFILKTFGIYGQEIQTAVYAREVADYQINSSYEYDSFNDVWYQTWESNNPYFYNFVYRNPADITGLTFIGTASSQDHYYDATELNDVVQYATIPNGRTIEEVLKFLVAKIGSYTLVSSLFFGDTDEFGNAIGNYLDSGTDLTKLRIHQITDVKQPLASESATKMEFSLKELLEDINILFGYRKVGFFIDTAGELRIEHVHYFETTAFQSAFNNIDLRNKLNTASGLPFINKSNKYEFADDDIYNREIYKYQNFVRENNVANVVFNGVVTEGLKLERDTKLLVSDVDGIVEQPDEFNDSLVFIAITDNLNRIYKTSNAASPSGNLYNGYLDMPVLSQHYWRNGMASGATVNGIIGLSPRTALKCKFQKIRVFLLNDITVPSEVLPLIQRFRTFLNENKTGTEVYGSAETIEFDLSTNFLTIILKLSR